MTSEQTGKGRLKKVLRLLAFAALAVAAVAFAAPNVRKTDAIGRIGTRTVDELSAFATAVSYSENVNIAALTKSPQIDATYRHLAGLFAQVSVQKGYERMLLLTRSADGQYHVLTDGAYRENAPEEGYYAPDALYPADAYKPAKSILDAIYSGKTQAGYVSNLIARPDGKQVVGAYLPVYGSSAAVLGVIGVECDPGDTRYHMLGPVNLTWVGTGAVLLFIFCVLLLYLGGRISDFRRQRQEAAAAQSALPPPDAGDSAPQPAEESGGPKDETP